MVPASMRRFALAILVALLGGSGIGCGGQDDDAPRVDPSLIELWTLTTAEVDEETGWRVLVPDAVYTVEFTDQAAEAVPAGGAPSLTEAGGSLLARIEDGCNECFGRYDIEAEGRLRLRVDGCTDVFCPDRSELGRGYLDGLESASTYEVYGSVLRLRGGVAPGGPLVLRFSDRSGVAELDAGEQSAVADRRLVVIQDSGEFATIWGEHCPGGACGRAMPVVNFVEFSVLAVFSDARPSSGYAVAVEAVEPGPDDTLVRVVRIEPGAECVVPAVVTTPYQFLRVDRITQPVRLVERTEVRSCQ